MCAGTWTVVLALAPKQKSRFPKSNRVTRVDWQLHRGKLDGAPHLNRYPASARPRLWDTLLTSLHRVDMLLNVSCAVLLLQAPPPPPPPPPAHAPTPFTRLARPLPPLLSF